MFQQFADLALRFVVAVEKIADALNSSTSAENSAPAETGSAENSAPKKGGRPRKETKTTAENPPATGNPPAGNASGAAGSETSQKTGTEQTGAQSAGAEDDFLCGGAEDRPKVTKDDVMALAKSVCTTDELKGKAREIVNTIGNAPNITSIKEENLRAVYDAISALKK